MFDRLIVLLPHHSLEEFDLQRKEDDAEGLLSAWSALWHPLLVAGTQAIPGWAPAASPPQEPAGFLIVVPECSESLLPEEWLPQAEAAGACVLRKLRRRGDIVAAALQRLEAAPSAVDADLAADFLALGFCHLQVELLTRKLRYMSNLDEASLQTAVLSAAGELIAGDAAATRHHLQSAFDRLHEAREYFYPIETRLLDLTLVAPSTLGPALRDELAGGLPRNLLASGAVIEEMAAREPATLDALKQALQQSAAGLIGGEFTESPLSMLEPEAIRAQLRRGLDAYQKHLGRRPTVFGRRRFGLTPVLPQILAPFGFTAALHCTLDDGRFPTANQSRIQWEGVDGTTLEALAIVPLDAGRSDSFLRLAQKLSDTMGLDHTATVVMAHWPGHTSPWYDDMRRIAGYGSVLGQFATIDDYFQQTAYAGQRTHNKSDQYRSPYLKQDVAAGRRDPISRWIRYYARRTRIESLNALAMLSAACGVVDLPLPMGEGWGEGGIDTQQQPALTLTLSGHRPKVGRERGPQLAIDVEDSLDADPETAAALDQRLDAMLAESAAAFSQAVASGGRSDRGCLVINPWSFPQQACLHPSSFTAHPPLLDVPAMGFAWVAHGTENQPVPQPVERKGWFGRGKAKVDPPLAEENVLRNEFFEVRFDPCTGAIRTISDYHSRDPRLAQQIAFRLPQGDNREPGDDANYSIMAADELTVTSAGPALGEIVCRGRLMARDGRRLAGFRQTTRARRGSRIIEIDIELDADHQPGPNPWDSYYALRFAWKDETAALCRSVHLAGEPTDLTQFESPHFVDIRRGKQRTTLLCGGLPYHRRLGPRKLDTLLVVQGETARSFRLGIGIDLPHPTAAALGFLAPPIALADQPSPPAPSGWLFHLDCRNVLATNWEPLLRTPHAPRVCTPHAPRVCTPHAPREETPGETPRQTDGLRGFRVRLLETDGRGGQLGLRCFRSVASARKINPGDVPPVELTVADDCATIHVGPHQWTEVEVLFHS
jgi:alpha-mannosidase